ncbi:MAG: hypothetical protein IKZ47_02405 [Clostridia bacterium]|nr:hypothetical protein [Clostridia bacterium]
MHHCPDCNVFVEDPIVKNFKISGKNQKKLLCPVCLGELNDAPAEYCRYCGNRLSPGTADGYCGDTCRRLGRRLWTRELIRRRRIKDDPLARILRMLTSYNKEHNTNLSYGQFVSFVLPKLDKRKKRAYGY